MNKSPFIEEHLGESLGIPRGWGFTELHFSRAGQRLVGLFKRLNSEVPTGRLFTRSLGERNYKPIVISDDEVSVRNVLLPLNVPVCFVNTLKFSGRSANWYALHKLDLTTLQMECVLSYTDLHTPKPFDEVGIVDMFNVSEDCRTIDCSLFLRNSKDGGFGYYLSTIWINEKRCEIMDHLPCIRF